MAERPLMPGDRVYRRVWVKQGLTDEPEERIQEATVVCNNPGQPLTVSFKDGTYAALRRDEWFEAPEDRKRRQKR